MKQPLDWDKIRRLKFIREKPPADWPPGVNSISIEGVSLLGIDANNNLYWDGKLLQTATTLGRTERLIALAVAFSTIAVAIIEAIRLVLGR
ncbi:hypothetical protein [Rhizobium mongolense]|uniref:hypothetical protein n=1 Tax=Rhizobium mongolense TaxID=57676 RepID=UPI0034A26A6E